MKFKHTYPLILGVITVLIGLQGHAKESKSPDYTQYAAEVTSSFLKQVYKEFGFECGASGGRMPYDVEEISVKLVAYQDANIEQARELEINLTERFVQIINAHEKIRPFLREYPFPPNRANVAISFRKKKKSKTGLPDDDVTFVFQAKNRIYYQAKNPNDRYLYKDIKDESYGEAREIVYKNAHKNPQQEPKKL